MQAPPAQPAPAPAADTWTPPVPELVEVPDDLPVLEPSHVITLPLNEEITSVVVVPDEHEGNDVLYVAVSQERVNVWAAVVYFVPEIALGVTGVLVLVALRKWWVGRRFLHRKGEAYCKKCWAGLTGVESAACPECGRKVAKTKRIAKRSRRSPLKPKWLWLYAATVACLATAILLFGEGWLEQKKIGFDYKIARDWRGLIDYADRESIFRINPMAGWFHCYSPRLSSFGRHHNHTWIEELEVEYHEGEGIRNRILIRRYTVEDGKPLGEVSLPSDWSLQDTQRGGGAWFVPTSDILFVLDGNCFYRLSADDDDQWVKFEPPRSNSQMMVAGVSHDGSHIVIGYHGYGRGYIKTAEVIQLIAYETDKGTAVGTLDITPQGHVDTFSADGHGHTNFSPMPGTTLKDIMMPEHGGRVLLYFDKHENLPQTPIVVAWDFLDQTIQPEEQWTTSDIGLDHLLLGYYPWSIISINGFDDDFGRGYLGAALLSPSQRFQLWSEESRRAGEAVGSLPVTTFSLRAIPREYPEPYDRYDPLTSVPLYDIATATSHTQPSRVLAFDHPHGQEQVWATLSRSGERGIVHVGANGPLLLVDIENAKALAHVGYGIDGFIDGEFFVNDGRQLIDLHMSPHPPFPAQQTSFRHELLIFDVP